MEEGAAMGSPILREVEMKILDNSACHVIDETIIPAQMCAGFISGGKDTCQVIRL